MQPKLMGHWFEGKKSDRTDAVGIGHARINGVLRVAVKDQKIWDLDLLLTQRTKLGKIKSVIMFREFSLSTALR